MLLSGMQEQEQRADTWGGCYKLGAPTPGGEPSAKSNALFDNALGLRPGHVADLERLPRCQPAIALANRLLWKATLKARPRVSSQLVCPAAKLDVLRASQGRVSRVAFAFFANVSNAPRRSSLN